MGIKKKRQASSEEDFDILYLEDDNDEIEDWVDNDEDAEIDWIHEEDDTQIGRLDNEEDAPVYKSRPKSKRRRSKNNNSAGKTGNKVVKTGGKAVRSTTRGVFKVIQVFAHLISLALVVFIMYLIADAFWKHYASWGSLRTMISERNYTLAGFLSVGAFLLLFELIMFFWAITKPRTGKHSTSSRQDTGRGLFSFLFIGILVFLASYFNGFIPTSHNVLIGIREGVILYGSLFHILLPVCIAGLISCLIRKFTNRAHR